MDRMEGLIVTFFYGVILYFLREVPALEVFLSATSFLFWWYIVTSAMLGIIVIPIALGVWGGRIVEGARKIGLLGGGLLDIPGGGVLSALILVQFAISAGCSISGAYLLHNSLTFTSAGATQWDTIKLIFGSLFLVIGLIIRKVLVLQGSKKD